MKQPMMFYFKTLIFLFLFIESSLQASSCCGGGSSVSGALISGDDKAILNFSYSTSDIKTRVDSQGLWKKDSNDDPKTNAKLEGSHIFLDRFQAGLSMQMSGEESQSSQQQIGDAVLTLAYEAMPDWDYNPIRPKGIAFLNLTAPTGHSVYDKQSANTLNVGRGFWSIGLGALFLKSYKKWDASSTLETHRFLNRNDNSIANQSVQIKPGQGYSVGFGLGYNLKDFRLGLGADFNYEDPIRVRGDIHDESSLKRFSNLSFSLNYLVDSFWSCKLAYADQTVLGAPLSSELAQSWSFSVQKKWSR